MDVGPVNIERTIPVESATLASHEHAGGVRTGHRP